MRLSPLDPSMFAIQGAVAFAHFLAGRYDEASSWAERAFREQPDFLLPVVAAAASNALAGRLEEAHKAIEHLHKLHPTLRISNLAELTPFRKPQDLGRLEEALRKAGLPE
jgi:tetratricopeptide (TPR) repeat protein